MVHFMCPITTRAARRRRGRISGAGSAAALAVLVILAIAHSAAAQEARPAGAVLVASNAADGNAILAFPRAADGNLGSPHSIPTGGLGTGEGLGNQGGILLSPDHRHLLAVNAGSNSLSLFALGPDGLELLDVVPSRGSLPKSVALFGNLVYVLNAGGPGNIAGYRLTMSGRLRPLPGSLRPLGSDAADPAQISFSRDGSFLVVTEKATNTITTYAVHANGRPGRPVTSPAAGETPFGFAFDLRGHLIVSEAFGGVEDASTVSSYELADDGSVVAIDPLEPTHQSAACWAVVTPHGLYAYVTNTGSDSLTGYRIARDGSLALLDGDGITALTGDAPIDMGLSRDGRLLYTLDSGSESLTATVSAFRVNLNGSLTAIGTFSGVPLGATGLAAF